MSFRRNIKKKLFNAAYVEFMLQGLDFFLGKLFKKMVSFQTIYIFLKQMNKTIKIIVLFSVARA